MPEIRHDILGCCGLKGYKGMNDVTPDYFRRKGKLNGAWIMATTITSQAKANKCLKEFGFTPTEPKTNDNSNNRVIIWLMSRIDYNKKVGKLQDDYRERMRNKRKVKV